MLDGLTLSFWLLKDHPDLVRDQFWDELFPEMPYTAASEDTKIDPVIGSAAQVEVCKGFAIKRNDYFISHFSSWKELFYFFFSDNFWITYNHESYMPSHLASFFLFPLFCFEMSIFYLPSNNYLNTSLILFQFTILKEALFVIITNKKALFPQTTLTRM